MATLSSIIGTPLDQLEESQLTEFVENFRSVRQTFTEGAYEERKTKRTASAKRKGKDVSLELLAEIDDLADDLELDL